MRLTHGNIIRIKKPSKVGTTKHVPKIQNHGSDSPSKTIQYCNIMGLVLRKKHFDNN